MKIIAYTAAYGSLVDANSRKSTIGKTKKVLAGILCGLERTWMADGRNNPNHKKFWIVKPDGTETFHEQLAPVFRPAYLDLKPNPFQRTVCAMIPVTEEQIEALDKRESGYDRIDVTHLMMTWNKNVPVFTYISKAEGRIGIAHKEAAIPAPYLLLCRNAAIKFGHGMGENFYNHITNCSDCQCIKPVTLGDNVTY